MAGANPAMVVRIAANIEELRKALAEGGQIITATTAGMEKMVKSFSGDRLIQQAHNVVAAINQIGGVSKLTAAEQERVHATVSKALEKYEALGREAPEALRQVAAATKGADDNTSSWTTTISDFKTQFMATMSGFLSAEAIIGTVKGAFNAFIGVLGLVKDAIVGAVLHTAELGDHFLTLSNQTGVSVEKLAEWNYVGEQTGTTLETMTTSVFKLQANLGEGGKQVAQALKAIGLSLSDLKAMKPEEAFEQVITKLKAVPQTSEQAALGVQLFGRGFKDMSQLMREDMSGLIQRFKDLGGGVTTEMAVAADAFKDAKSDWNVLVERVQTSVGSAILPALIAFATVVINSVSKVLNDAGVNAKTFETDVTNAFAGIVDGAAIVGQAIGFLTRAFGEMAGGWIQQSGAMVLGISAVGEKLVAMAMVLDQMKTGGLFSGVLGNLRDIFQEGARVGSGMVEAGGRIREAFSTAGAAIGRVAEEMKGKGGAALDGVRQGLQNAADAMRRLQDDFGKGGTVIGATLTEMQKKVIALRDQLSGAALQRDLETLLAAWKGLSDQQKGDPEVVGRVVEAYKKLREQGANSDLLNRLEETHRINVLLGQDYRNLALWIQAFTLPLARMHENIRTNEGFLKSFANTLGVEIETGIKKNVIAIDAHEAATQKWIRAGKQAGIDWSKSLQDISRAFAELAQTSGGLSGFAQAIGEITSAMSIAVQVGEQAGHALRTAFKGTEFDQEGNVIEGKSADLKERGAAIMQLVGTIIQGVAAIDAATQGTSVGAAILGGALSGAGFGAAIAAGLSQSAWAGPIGAAIGLGVGAIIGGIRASKEKSDEVMKEVGRDLGIALSESLSKQIEQDAKVIFGGTSAGFRTVARAFNLDAIIKEQGGIRTATMFEKFTGELHNMLGFVEQGRMTAEQAVDAIGRAFPAFAAYLNQSTELASKSWTDFLEHHKNLGLKTKEVTDFVVAGVSKIAGAISAMLGPLQKEYGGLAQKISDAQKAAAEPKLQEAIEAGAQLVQTRASQYAEAMHSVEQAQIAVKAAMEDGSPTKLAEAEQQLKLAHATAAKAAEEHNKALTELQKAQGESQKAADELNKLLVIQADGARKAGPELQRMGTLALAAFTAAREQGASYLEAMRATSPALQQMTGLYKDLNLALPTADENFALRWLLDQQALIDKMPELVSAQEAVNTAALAFSHIGGLNKDVLASLGAQAAVTTDKMIAGGFGASEALAQVQDFLRLAKQRYQELGEPIDENTQRLIDMADAAGLSTDPIKTAADTFQEFGDTLKEGLGAIITLLGGELPAAWQTATTAGQQYATETSRAATQSAEETAAAAQALAIKQAAYAEETARQQAESAHNMRLKVASEYQVILTDSASKSGQVTQTWKNCWSRSTWSTSDIDRMFDQVVSGADDAASQVEDILSSIELPPLVIDYTYNPTGEGLPPGVGGEPLAPFGSFTAGEAGFRSAVVAGSTGPVTLVNPRSSDRDLLSEMRRMNQLLAKSSETPNVVVVPLGPDESWESFSARLSRTMPVRVAKSSTLQDAWRRAVPNK